MSVYFDYNATTPIASSVIKKITECLENKWANASSSYTLGRTAKQAIDEARAEVGRMINAKPEEIIFTSGGTEANNIAIFGMVDYYKNWLNALPSKTSSNAKPHAVTTNVEHDAVMLPLQHLKNRGEIDLSVIPVSSNGCVTVDDISACITPSTCFVSVMQANNETGVIMPVIELGRMLRKVNKTRAAHDGIRILYHIDAAQAVGKIDVNVEELTVDYLTIVGHKFYGPRVGALYVRSPGRDNPIKPLMYGGGQERGWRPGTENTAMIVGLGEAAQLVSKNLFFYQDHMLSIRNYLEEKLEEAFGKNEIVFNCSQGSRLPNTCNISFVNKELNGSRILSNCQYLLASTGAACHDQNIPSRTLIASGVPAHLAANSIRLSVGRDTTKSDVDTIVNDLKEAVQKVKSISSVISDLKEGVQNV